MGLRDLPNLAPIRARLARATVVVKKAGANAPASILRRCVGSPYSSFFFAPTGAGGYGFSGRMVSAFRADDTTNAAKGARLRGQSICP
jgi:hypothetical protein